MLVHTHVLVLFDDQVGDGNDDGDEGYEIRKEKHGHQNSKKSKRPNCGLHNEGSRARERAAGGY